MAGYNKLFVGVQQIRSVHKMDVLTSDSAQPNCTFEKGKTFASIVELRQFVAGWALKNCVPYYSKASSRREFQAVCPNVKNLTRKEVKDQKKCPFYLAAYRRRNDAFIQFTKACKPKHHKDCTARKRTATTTAVKEYVTPLCNFMRDMDPSRAIDICRVTQRNRCGCMAG